MFENFIYYIVALIIYSTYIPSNQTNFAPIETLILFLCLLFVFFWFSKNTFKKLEKRIPIDGFYRLDSNFSSALTRLSIMAIAVFALEIYGLNLSSFFRGIWLFSVMPTLQALLFMALFSSHLAMVWALSYPIHRKLYPTDISGKTYVFSKITISAPVLLPWLLLSIILDIINALPFEAPKRFLSSTQGEIIFFLVFLIGVAITGPAMIQKFWRCKPLETSYMRNRIENLCQRAGLKVADILYWPIFGGSMITAGVMGLINRFRYILITKALFRYLDLDEIDAVIAHEIGHVKKKHLIFYLLFFIGFLVLSVASRNLINILIFLTKPVYQFISSNQINPIMVTSVIENLFLILSLLLYFRFIFGYFMRNFERQADLYVYKLFDNAKPLISTLKKIAHSSGQSPDKPNWHHFSISERVAYLEKCEADRSWITHHDRKIKKSIYGYTIVIFVMAVVGYQLNFGEAGKELNSHFFEKIVLRQIDKNPNDAHLFTILGDLRYTQKNYEGTVTAYTEAIRLNPKNASALNNLAWLYATCEEKRFHNPHKAIGLAEQAVNLSRAPYILDTLAESYYAAGMYKRALAVEQQVLQMDNQNRSYYLRQIRKFKDAVQKDAGESP